MNSTLVILGMHRSGTSLCANWLHKCGLNLGNRLMGAGTGNNKGHFEDLDFYNFHEDVFKQQGVPYGGLVPTHHIELDLYFSHRLDALIDLKNKLTTHWGWKDPRTCLFTHLYAERLRNPIYLIVFRPCSEVVQSLWNRKQKDDQTNNCIEEQQSFENNKLIHDYIECWIQYNQQILNLINNLDTNKYFITTIASLINNDKIILDWINRHDFKLNSTPFSKVYDESLLTSHSPQKIPYSEGQQERVQLIEEAFTQNQHNLPSSEKFTQSYQKEYYTSHQKFSEQVLLLEKKLKCKNEELTSKNKEIQEKEDCINKLNNTIESARKWQNDWFRRAFHKWRPNDDDIC